MESSFQLTLEQPAKSAGGDKYKSTGVDSQDAKESFIYVPQSISRVGGKALSTLVMKVSTTTGEMVFTLFKEGKTGDDRYKSDDETVWKGDIYLERKFRNIERKIYVTFP